MSNLDDTKAKNTLTHERKLDPLLAKKKAMDKLLNRKRDATYDFFSNKLSLIFLVVLTVGLAYGLFNNISTTVGEIQNNELGLNIISAIIELVIGFFVPVGFAFIYFGAKKKNANFVKNGMLYIDKYFGFLRLLSILLGIGIGIFLVIALPWGAFPKILMLLLSLLLTGVSIYVLNIFKKFVERISTEFNREYTFFPDGKNIRTYVIGVVAIYLVYIVLNIVAFSSADALIDFLPELETLVESTNFARALSYVAFVISGSILGFFLYYINSYCNYFAKFNEEHAVLINKKK